MDALHVLFNAVQSEEYWLPQGSTWKDWADARAAGILLPAWSDAWTVAQLTVLVTVLRFVLEWTVFKAAGKWILTGRAKARCARACVLVSL